MGDLTDRELVRGEFSSIRCRNVFFVNGELKSEKSAVQVRLKITRNLSRAF